MNPALISIGKLTSIIFRSFKLGNGSTWPGHIALESNNNFIKQILAKNPKLKVIFVAGTNGKTTTSLMLKKILKEKGLRVFQNEAGANLLNGIASSIITHSTLSGKINYDVAIFETDENNFPYALEQVNPHSILLLNLFRDQLDRYGEVNTIANKWADALSKLPPQTHVYTNGDDPKLSHIAKSLNLNAGYFGVDEAFMKNGVPGYDVDFTYCPNCQTKLHYQKVAFSHLGRFTCPKCKYKNPKVETFKNLPHSLLGIYNVYNANAAAILAHKAFGIDIKTISKALENFKAAFGRQEVIAFKDKKILMLLSKNPAGFNQSIDAISMDKKGGSVLLILNDRVPDGRDVSWIWDVDFEKLPANAKIFIAGDRAYDMALRIKYLDSNSQYSNSNFQTNVQIFNELSQALENAVEQTKPEETLFILPTYSAMLEARKILTGKSIL